MKTRSAIVLLGPPASGKGTQAQRIAASLGGLHISTGYLLRQAVLMGTPLGKQVQKYVDAGDLVPDGLVLSLVRETLAGIEDRVPAILDGFPRTLSQAEALDAFLPPNKVILIELDEGEVIRRITGRRIGPHGEPYHVLYNPPPPGVTATRRSDDREEVVRERLAVYQRQTEPLLDYYAQRKVLHRVSGLGSIGDVFRRIISSIGSDSAAREIE